MRRPLLMAAVFGAGFSCSRGLNRKSIKRPGRHAPLHKAMEKEFLSIKEVGEYLGMKTSTLYFHVENSSIPHYRVGRLIRFRKRDIDEWMDGNRRERGDLSKIASQMLAGTAKRPLDIRAVVKKTIAEGR